MDWRERYADKLTSAEEAVGVVRDGNRVVIGMHYQTPLGLCRALAAAAAAAPAAAAAVVPVAAAAALAVAAARRKCGSAR